MRYYPKIKGEKVYLSPINMDDLEQYTAWINDPGVSDNLGSTCKVYSLEQERAALEEMAKGGYFFAIVEAKEHRLLGNTGLEEISWTDRKATCGIMLGNPEDRHKGYGSEALRLLLGYGFDTLNLHNIMLRVFAYNPNAVACYEKLGFHTIGRRRNCSFCKGSYHDQILMDILAEEFNQTREG